MGLKFMVRGQLTKIAKAFKYVIDHPHNFNNESFALFEHEISTIMIDDVIYYDLIEICIDITKDVFLTLYYNSKKKYLLMKTQTISREPYKYKIFLKETYKDVNLAIYNFMVYSKMMIFLNNKKG